jgi:hypothetical protein
LAKRSNLATARDWDSRSKFPFASRCINSSSAATADRGNSIGIPMKRPAESQSALVLRLPGESKRASPTSALKLLPEISVVSEPRRGMTRLNAMLSCAVTS